MRKITIIFHSGYGHTKRVAEHVHKGVVFSDVTVESIAIDSEGNLPEAAWQTLQDSDAIIFGTPTYMGGPSWQFKKFADASSKQWFAMAWKGKVAAGFTNSGSITGDKGSCDDEEDWETAGNISRFGFWHCRLILGVV